MKNKRLLARFTALFTALLLLAGLFSGCASDTKADIIESIDQLNSEKYTINAGIGAKGATVAEKLFPNANITYSSTDSDAYLMVETGKADAYIHDKSAMEYAIATGAVKGMSILDGDLDSIEIAVGVSPDRSDLIPELNEFIKVLRADGTLDQMYDRWVRKADDRMPDIAKPENPDKIIKVATAGVVTPMTYYGEGNEVKGFDIELLQRYALYVNAEIELQVIGFDALIASLESGRVDLAFSNLNITEERREAIGFSEPYLYCETALLVKSERLPDHGKITKAAELDGKKIGCLLGASYLEQVNEWFPNSEVVCYDTYSDAIQALKSGKIGAYLTDEPMAVFQAKETQGLRVINELLSKDRYGFIYSYGSEELRDKINAVIKKFSGDGTLKRLKEKWISGDGDDSLAFDESIPTPNGVLEIATTDDSVPFAYRVGENTVGYDVELTYLICAELGYKPKLTAYKFAALLPAVTSGKGDIGIGCITYTDLRAETMLFSDSTYDGGIVAVVYDGAEGSGGFWEELRSNIDKSLIQEDRWKLLANGLLVTVIISLASVVFGTALGFAFSFMLRSRKKLVSGIAGTVGKLFDGLPLLVILMVLYYVIFASSDLSAMSIGIIGFTLTFANTAAGILNTGIKAVDVGQIEAARSMGYSRLKVFQKITFPQAANQMFGQYSASIISLIKETSIVGYITIEDLTRAGDIIRSRTYEAFFPLIITAIVYFVIARVFVSLLAVFAKKLDPKRRKRYVKGVKCDD